MPDQISKNVIFVEICRPFSEKTVLVEELCKQAVAAEELCKLYEGLTEKLEGKLEEELEGEFRRMAGEQH